MDRHWHIGWDGAYSRVGRAHLGGLPLVWTPSMEWKNGKFVAKWKMHKLDTTNLLGLTGFVVWGVNDYGQAIGTGWNSDQSFLSAVLWNPRHDGKGWELMPLQPSQDLPLTQAYDINDRGEIVGVSNSADFSIWLPRLWKPLDRNRTTYSQAIELPLPKGGFTNCENVGINELGDMVGDCWSDTEDLPTRWTTKDLASTKIINFPGTWGLSWGVNNDQIAVLIYGDSKKCPADTYVSCGGAVQLH